MNAPRNIENIKYYIMDPKTFKLNVNSATRKYKKVNEGGDLVVIYEGLYFDLTQGQMNGAPNETRTHSCRFASLTCKPLHHQRCPKGGDLVVDFDDSYEADYHILSIRSRSNRMISWIATKFISRETNVHFKLYKTRKRPHIKYCI